MTAAKASRATYPTAREFGAAMGALGAVIEDDMRLLMIHMTWRLVDCSKRRAGVLKPAEAFRPRDVRLPRSKGGK